MNKIILIIMLTVIISMPQSSGEIIILFDQSHTPSFTINPSIPAYDAGGGYQNLSAMMTQKGYTINATHVTSSWEENDSYAYPGAIAEIYIPEGNTNGFFNLTNFTMPGFTSMYSMIMAVIDNPVNVDVHIRIQGYNNESPDSFGTDNFEIPAGHTEAYSHRWIGEFDVLREMNFAANITEIANCSFNISFYRWYPLLANYTVGDPLTWNNTPLQRGLNSTNLLIIPGSKWNYSEEEVNFVKQYIRNGGNVLFLLKAYDYNNGTNNLLRAVTGLKVISMVQSDKEGYYSGFQRYLHIYKTDNASTNAIPDNPVTKNVNYLDMYEAGYISPDTLSLYPYIPLVQTPDSDIYTPGNVVLSAVITANPITGKGRIGIVSTTEMFSTMNAKDNPVEDYDHDGMSDFLEYFYKNNTISSLNINGSAVEITPNTNMTLLKNIQTQAIDLAIKYKNITLSELETEPDVINFTTTYANNPELNGLSAKMLKRMIYLMGILLNDTDTDNMTYNDYMNIFANDNALFAYQLINFITQYKDFTAYVIDGNGDYQGFYHGDESYIPWNTIDYHVAPGENLSVPVYIEDVGTGGTQNLTFDISGGFNASLNGTLHGNILLNHNELLTLPLSINIPDDYCSPSQIYVNITSADVSILHKRIILNIIPEISKNFTAVLNTLNTSSGIEGKQYSIDADDYFYSTLNNTYCFNYSFSSYMPSVGIIERNLKIKNTGNIPDAYNITVTPLYIPENVKISSSLSNIKLKSSKNSSFPLKIAFNGTVPGNTYIIYRINISDKYGIYRFLTVYDRIKDTPVIDVNYTVIYMNNNTVNLNISVRNTGNVPVRILSIPEVYSQYHAGIYLLTVNDFDMYEDKVNRSINPGGETYINGYIHLPDSYHERVVNININFPTSQKNLHAIYFQGSIVNESSVSSLIPLPVKNLLVLGEVSGISFEDGYYTVSANITNDGNTNLNTTVELYYTSHANGEKRTISSKMFINGLKTNNKFFLSEPGEEKNIELIFMLDILNASLPMTSGRFDITLDILFDYGSGNVSYNLNSSIKPEKEFNYTTVSEASTLRENNTYVITLRFTSAFKITNASSAIYLNDKIYYIKMINITEGNNTIIFHIKKDDYASADKIDIKIFSGGITLLEQNILECSGCKVGDYIFGVAVILVVIIILAYVAYRYLFYLRELQRKN